MAWYNKLWDIAYTKPNKFLFGEDTNQENRSRADEWMKGRTPWNNSTRPNWHELVNMQRSRALGLQPSLAEAQYKQAMGDTQAALYSAGNATTRPGAMRAAMQQQANLGQGMAAGLAQAGMQERAADQQSYAAGLQGLGAVESEEADRLMQLLQARLGIAPSPSKWDRAASAFPLLAMLSKKDKQT